MSGWVRSEVGVHKFARGSRVLPSRRPAGDRFLDAPHMSDAGGGRARPSWGCARPAPQASRYAGRGGAKVEQERGGSGYRGAEGFRHVARSRERWASRALRSVGRGATDNTRARLPLARPLDWGAAKRARRRVGTPRCYSVVARRSHWLCAWASADSARAPIGSPVKTVAECPR